MSSCSNGPVSTLPGSFHSTEEGAMCDLHPDRKSVVRIQSETDSFGAEYDDMCQECFDTFKLTPNAGIGECDWCKNHSDNLQPARDYDEGMFGPVYEVCPSCRKRQNDDARDELDSYDD